MMWASVIKIKMLKKILKIQTPKVIKCVRRSELRVMLKKLALGVSGRLDSFFMRPGKLVFLNDGNKPGHTLDILIAIE